MSNLPTNLEADNPIINILVKFKANEETLRNTVLAIQSICLSVIGEDDDSPGVLRDSDGDPVDYEEVRSELRAEQRLSLKEKLQ